MNRKEIVPVNERTRINIKMYRDQRGALIMWVQEVNIDPENPGWETFMLYSSWSHTVARCKYPRVTAKVASSFWDANIEEARSLAAQRVAVLTHKE